MTDQEKQAAFKTLLSLLAGKADVFHSPDGEPFIRVAVGDHRENYPLKKKGPFREWCEWIFFAGTNCALPKQIFEIMFEQLHAQAKFDAPEFQTSLRIAEYDGKIYLDLCNAKWQCIEIDTNGWRLIEDPPVRFRRSQGMMALPLPEPAGSIEDLFQFINVRNRPDQQLVLAWLLATYRPTGPFPILALHGAQGSAKTTTETILRRMVDPAKANLSGVPRDERDLLISTQHSHLLGFDNFSGVSDSLSDALCRIATGSGLSTRKLYTDDTQIIFNACRPILLNGITDLATRGDLLDRMIILHLPKIEETQRKDERTLLREFEVAQPRILGAMLDAVSFTLGNIDKTVVSNLPRMADFCRWAASGSKALGFSTRDFIAAYDQNRREANFIALENAPAAVELYKWAQLRAKTWEGNCRELLSELNLGAPEDIRRDPHWPKSARGISAVLARCGPNLETAGVLCHQTAS